MKHQHCNYKKTIAHVIPALVVLLPFFLILAQKGAEVIPNFFEADTFYYLTVANNSSFGWYTFDGVTSTNGFHPLWQIFLERLFHLLDISGKPAQINAAFAVSLFLVAVSVVMLANFVYRITGSLTLTAILPVPGVYTLLSMIVDHGSIWTFANGMETPLSLFGGALLLLLMSKYVLPLDENNEKDDRFFIYAGWIVAFIVFSRLDDIFLLLSFVMVIACLNKTNYRKSIREVSLISYPTLIFLCVYLNFNLFTVGVALPTSGALKASFSGLSDNLQYTFNMFMPTLWELFSSGRYYSPYYLTLEKTNRILQMVIPFVFAISVMYLYRKAFRQRWVVYGLCLYIVIKCVYNFCFVTLLNQGDWYYPLSLYIIMNAVVALLFKDGFMKIPERGFSGMLSIMWLLFTLTVLANFMLVRSSLPLGKSFASLYEDRMEIERGIKAGAGYEPRIFEMDDGILAYALEMPTINGLALCADPDTVSAKKNNELFSHAYQRGHNIITSYQYIPFVRYGGDAQSEKIRKALKNFPYLKDQDVDRFEYRIIYVHKPTQIAFVEFHPAGR